MTPISTGEKFPYSTHIYRLEFTEKKENRVCWFECQEHVDRFLKRHNLKKNQYTLDIKSDVRI